MGKTIMTKILLSTVAALAFVGTASAADLPVKAPPVLAPAFTWTGCYLGANIGAVIGADKLDRYTYATGAVLESYSSSKSAVTVGGQFGCQVQWSWFVFGGEMDLAYSGLDENVGSLVAVAGGYNINKQLDWFGTGRLKAGIAFDRVLVYATGGVAYSKLTSNYADPLAPVALANVGAWSDNRIGYTVGGGIEYAITNNWSVKAEYLFLDFGSFNYRIGPVATPLAFGATAVSIDATEHVARVGFNYSFRPAVAAPVLAKY